MAWNIPCLFIRQFVLHNKDIFCYFGSFLVDSGHFQLSNSTSTTFLLVELVVIKHGRHSFMLVLATSRGMFSYSWHSPKGCAMPSTSFEVSNITSIEYLLISYHLKCQGTFRAFTDVSSDIFQYADDIRQPMFIRCIPIFSRFPAKNGIFDHTFPDWHGKIRSRKRLSKLSPFSAQPSSA